MKFKLSLILSLFSVQLFSQGTSLPLGNDSYRILDRFDIKSGLQHSYNSSLKTYTRGDAMRFLLQFDTAAVPLSAYDEQELYYMYCENNEWLSPDAPQQNIAGKKAGYYKKIPGDTLYRFIPASQIQTSLESQHYIKNEKPIWGFFYSTPANWIQLDKKGFNLRVNPILNFKAFGSGDGDANLFINQRGIELRGGIDDRIYFYSNITDTQARFPEYVNNYVDQFQALPGNGLYKPYRSGVINGLTGLDYLNGQAYIGMSITKNVGLQFGHGKNFIGNGYRSMLLSDFSQNYLYLKLNWRFWKFHYQNLFTEFNANSSNAERGNFSLSKKYMAAHYLSFDISKNMSLGVFEAVIFQRENGFELQYLNPVILYRTVEHLLNSEDNVLLGLDFKWNILKKGRLYGQFILDEFKYNLSTGGDGWWGNKYGIQVGGQMIDAFGVDQLDLRLEYNMARPYTYSHSDSLGSSYTHYNQALAHPLGANFKEILGIVQYQPTKRILAEARIIRGKYGEDQSGKNWGGNILIPNTTREMDFGNEIGQGIATTTTLFGIDISYQFYHNMYLELNYFNRKKDSAESSLSDVDTYIGGGFRINVGKMRMDF